MIDRDARNRLLRGIDDYMEERISPDEFDILLHDKIAPKTKDEVVQEIVRWLFDSYEDIGTNRLQSECAYWKFFNRLRLLVTSDAECRFGLQPPRRRFSRWIGGISVPMLSLLAVVSLYLQSATLLVFVVPLYVLCGIVTFASLFFEKPPKPNRVILYAEYPFESFGELLALRRSVPHFSSKRFPGKPPLPASNRNSVVRFLWDTRCPVWVDRAGDAFVLVFCFFLGFFGVIVLWPLLILLTFAAPEEGQTRFVLPETPSEHSPASAPLS